MPRAKRITTTTGEKIRVTSPRTRVGRALEYSGPFYHPPEPPTAYEVLETYPSCGIPEHDARATKLASLLVGLVSTRPNLGLSAIRSLVMERTCACDRPPAAVDENLTTVPIGSIVEA